MPGHRWREAVAVYRRFKLRALRVPALNRVIVIGLDGLEPSIVENMLAAGELPNLAKVSARGGFGRIGTTLPAQTPVAWSTFATGTNPGVHGIFDFIRRDADTYLPDLSLNRYEQKNSFLPPKAVNLRRGTPMWEILASAGVASTIIRCPCTYPPDRMRGRMLSGMGVPDVRGGLGTGTFYTSAADVQPGESENVVHVEGRDVMASWLIGPKHPKTRDDVHLDIQIERDRDGGQVTVVSSGTPKRLVVLLGKWSEWLKVKFKVGMLQSVRGMVRFHLVRIDPELELYASPINFDPGTPMFPVSSPWDYAGELERRIGPYHTTGMVEDHTGLNNGRFDEGAYLDQCEGALREREAMMRYELDRFDTGLFYCLFDTPDRVQHMFWRFLEEEHPANHHGGVEQWKHVIRDHYRRCDKIVGAALEYVDDDTLFIVLSDHGFNSFQRGFNINTWLYDNGLLALQRGKKPGDETGGFLRTVDWSATKAYALGLGGIYLNVKGREAHGIVASEDTDAVADAIVAGLTGLTDDERGVTAVRAVHKRRDVYRGPCAEDSPDLVVGFSRGYRASSGTALGGVPRGHFEDNTKRWSGDHIIDPLLVPGMLAMNCPFQPNGASLVDMAPTILTTLGVDPGAEMEGESIL